MTCQRAMSCSHHSMCRQTTVRCSQCTSKRALSGRLRQSQRVSWCGWTQVLPLQHAKVRGDKEGVISEYRDECVLVGLRDAINRPPHSRTSRLCPPSQTTTTAQKLRLAIVSTFLLPLPFHPLCKPQTKPFLGVLPGWHYNPTSRLFWHYRRMPYVRAPACVSYNFSVPAGPPHATVPPA